jgi:hypothetical protein
MNLFIEFAQSAPMPEANVLRAGLFLTIAALAYIVRQPRKSSGKQGGK